MAEPSPFGPGNPDHPTLRYLFLRFLRIGFLAWGGPIAQIGLMHREIVERDRWVDETRFRKVLALYQALPGPEAHEMAVYFGMVKRGRWGGFLTGLAFMLPGVVLVTIAAAIYSATAGTMAAAQVLLYGVRPAVLGLIAWGFVKLARRSVTTPTLALVAGLAALVAFLLQPPFLLVLAAGGALALAWALARRRIPRPAATGGGGGGAAAMVPFALGAAAMPTLALVGLGALAWVGLSAGMLSFGGAYTAVPFLQKGLVEQQGWITNDAFLDAFALSGLLPAPLISVGVFAGFLVAGVLGALIMTITLFAPAFAFTLVGHEAMERAVDEPRLHEFLLGVTAAVIGLVLVASLPLARAAFVDVWTVGIGLAAFAALASGRVAIPWVLLASAALGGLVQLAL